jgi:hypothetical protein
MVSSPRRECPRSFTGALARECLCSNVTGCFARLDFSFTRHVSRNALWEAAIFLLGLFAVILLILAFREMGRAAPARAAALMRKSLAALALGAAALALARGHFVVALALAGAAALTASGKSFFAPFTPGGRRRGSGATVELEFDDSGVRDGAILAGPFAGSKLSELSRVECEAFHKQCRAEESEALLALEAYFDRRFPGWRAATHDDAHAWRARGAAGGGEMSEQEAYQALGLRLGASADEIVRAHRALMKEHHPDHGGTTDDAARLNQAKDRLLRRHG